MANIIKRMRVGGIFLCLLFFWFSASGAPIAAVLSGPDEVPLTGSEYPLRNAPFDLEIQWHELVPLTLGLHLIEGSLKTGGDSVIFSFKDSSGKEAQVWDIVGYYLPPQGEIRVVKGQTVKIGLTGHGWAKVASGQKYVLSVILFGRMKDEIVLIEGRKEIVFVRTSPPQEKMPNHTAEPASPSRGGSS